MTIIRSVFLLVLFTFHESVLAASNHINPRSDSKRGLSDVVDPQNGKVQIKLPPVEVIAESLLALLSKEEIEKLISLLDPEYKKRICSACKRSRYESGFEVFPEVFDEIMSKNLTEIPLQELIDIPEMLANGTNLRKIESTIKCVRPIRPRRKHKKRHPSNIPGSSPYVVHENVIEKWVPSNDEQVINRILYNSSDFENDDIGANSAEDKS